MGTTVLLLCSVIFGQRFSTSQALPNTVSASALRERERERKREREKERVRERENRNDRTGEERTSSHDE